MLQNIHQYRSALTVWLLLMYGFIAIPASLWHKHAAKKSISPTHYKLVLAKTHGASSCKLCDHHYTAATVTQLITAGEPPCFFITIQATLLPYTGLVKEWNSISGRGPPYINNI